MFDNSFEKYFLFMFCKKYFDMMLSEKCIIIIIFFVWNLCLKIVFVFLKYVLCCKLFVNGFEKSVFFFKKKEEEEIRYKTRSLPHHNIVDKDIVRILF
jgi:hypothetical protein